MTKAVIRFRQNIRLANDIARKIAPNPLDFASNKEDIYQEAYCGLWKACLNFDETKGFAFSTYAVPTIRGQILRFRRDSNTIKESRQSIRIRTIMIRLGIDYKDSYTDEDIQSILEYNRESATATPLSERTIRNFITQHSEMSEKIVHFESPLSNKNKEKDNDGDAELANIIMDKSINSQPEKFVEAEFFEQGDAETTITNLLEGYKVQISKCTKRNKDAVADLIEEWLYACLTGNKVSQVELSKKYNFSQAQVSKILKRFQNYCNKHRDSIGSYMGLI